MTPIELTKTEFIQRVGNFEESPKDWKYVGDKPCIVDFHAPWCGYCKRLEPILDEFAKEYDGKLYIYKVNVDNEEDCRRTGSCFQDPDDPDFAPLPHGRE